MEQHYLNIPWPCHHEHYNLAHFAQDILDGKVRAYVKDESGVLRIYEPAPARLLHSFAEVVVKMERQDLYFYKADLMMLDRDAYKFRLLELEPRIEEKDALIEKLKHRVAFLESYTDDENMRMNNLLRAFGIDPEAGVSAQPQEQTAIEENTPGTGKRGEIGRQKANLDRLKEWQTVFLPAMIKAAVALGGAGPQTEGNPRQRKDVQVELDKHLAGKKAPKAVLDMLYKALPDEYVDRKGGNTPIKPKMPPQV